MLYSYVKFYTLHFTETFYQMLIRYCLTYVQEVVSRLIMLLAVFISTLQGSLQKG